jgi:hypothetical protein
VNDPGYSDGERLMRLETIVAATVEATRRNTDSIDRLTGLIHGRPSWVVTLLLTGLSSTVGILATALVAGHR